MGRKILFVIGLLCLIVPVGIQIWDRQQQKNVIATHWEKLEKVDEEIQQNMVKSARTYNEKLYRGTEVIEMNYEEMLNLANDGIMGTIEIPKISLRLPIYHGTEKDVLSKGIGHLKESSLPVGGEDTHCVLTGHRGLPNAELFTRLDEMEKEDIFYIRVCGEVLTYKVSDICIVEPEKVEVLEIQESKDKVSLITCTPYGLNTHRLIVTGERIAEEEVVEVSKEIYSISKWNLLIIVIVLISICVGIRKQIRGKRGVK